MPKPLQINEIRERVWGQSESVEHPQGGKVWLRPPEPCEIPLLHDLLRTEISPGAGSRETMSKVFACNRDSFWLIEHLSAPGEPAKIIGFYSFLPLNAEGLARLEARTLDTSDPPLSLLARSGESPAARYVWAVVARRLMWRLMPSIARAMGLLYADAPIFARVATEDGRKACIGTGFSAPPDAPQIQLGSLIRLPPWGQGGALA
ncbi:MAG TPA: hypothetical protein VLC29_00560 [Rhizomicrobium sp.]|nr:hypothetical protein [Rhizomicrobium sp.]